MTDTDLSLIQRRRRMGWSAIGWLVLPVKPGRRSLPSLTRNRLIVIVLTAVFINRLKFLLPLLLIAGLAAWVIRPKKRR